MRFFAGIVICVFLATSAQAWFWESADERANKLFVEAKTFWAQAQTIEGKSLEQLEVRVKLLRQVDDNISKIISDYPESNLAVQLVSGPVGGLLAAEVDELVGEAEASLECFRELYSCVLSDALEAARSIEHVSFRAFALSMIAKAQAASGNISGTRRAAMEALEISRSDVDVRTLISVVEAQAASGDISWALATARSIISPRGRSSALSSVVEAQAASGDISGAIETARSMVYVTVDLVGAFSMVAEAQAASGDNLGAQASVMEALEIARSIQHTSQRVFALSRVAEARAAFGDISGAQASVMEALESARSIEGDSARVYALSSVAEAQAASGDNLGAQASVMEALEIARSVEDIVSSVHPLMKIAQAQVASGDITGALETARSIDERAVYQRGRALVRIAEAQAASGDISRALETARGIEGFSERADALSMVAAANVAFGNISEAQTVILEALETARSIEDADSRAFALSDILKVLRKE